MIRRTVLTNGIRVITEEVPHVRSVTIGLWVRVGSRDERASLHGISHFIEHMMFKGTERLNARQIAEVIDSAGGQLNAFTSKEHTCYYARVLDEHLETATQLLADMLLHSTFPQTEIEKEKSVVIEEIRMYEDSPDELVHELFAETALEGHPLGRGVLGSEESVRRIDRRAIESFLRRHYTAGRLVVAVAGHVNHDDVVRLVDRCFSEMPSSVDLVQTTPISSMGRRRIRLKETEQVHICVGVPGIRRNDPDRYALNVLDTALGGGMSSRLFQELREERGLVYATYSYHTCFQETGLFTIYAGAGPEHAPRVIDLIRQICDEVVRNGIGPEEAQRAKEQVKGSLMLSLESTANRMSRLAKSELFNEELISQDEMMARVESVTEEDLIRVARRLFADKELIITAVGPAQALLEEPVDLRSVSAIGT